MNTPQDRARARAKPPAEPAISPDRRSMRAQLSIIARQARDAGVSPGQIGEDLHDLGTIYAVTAVPGEEAMIAAHAEQAIIDGRWDRWLAALLSVITARLRRAVHEGKLSAGANPDDPPGWPAGETGQGRG